ncbi:MAG TPA: FemAB family XrtA/PEP-CTERM system-associated protein [Longimicrobiales bacterium]
MPEQLTVPAVDRQYSVSYDSVNASEWDEFVLADEEGTFCHLSAWRQVMEQVFRHRPYYLSVRNEQGRLAGLLPLVHVRSRLLGNYLMSVPFLNYGGPLGSDVARAALCAEATALADRLNVDLLELRSRRTAPPGLLCASRKITTVLPLPETSEELWEKGFRSKLRSQIRRPIKDGMEVHFGAAEIDPFYQIFACNMRDLGTPVLPRRWFAAINDAFPEQVIYAVVYFEGRPVAAGCGFHWRDEFEITWASSLREHASRSPNMLLYWSLMQECIRRGATKFNFGRSTPGASTHRFKQQWGGEDFALPWGIWGKKTAPPTPDSAKFALARAVWSRLPLPLANRVGPVIARQLP